MSQLSAAVSRKKKKKSVCVVGGVEMCVSSSQNRCNAAFGRSGDVGVVVVVVGTKKKKYRAPQIVFVRIPATRDCHSTMCSSALMCLAGLLEVRQK